MPVYLDDEHVMMHLDYMLVSLSALEEGHFLNTSSSRSPSTRSAPSPHLRPQLINPMMRHLPLLPSTYYPNPPQPQQDPDSGSIAISANPQHAPLHRLRPMILVPNPSLPLYCKRGGPRQKPSSPYLGKPHRVLSLPPVANSVHLLRHLCRAVSCVEIRIRSRLQSSRRVHLAVSSSPRNQESLSTAIQKKSLTLETITHASPGGPIRTQTGTPLLRFRRRANARKATRSSSDLLEHHPRIQRVPRSAPSSQLRCHWRGRHLCGS
jgi:hypothetical protein